MASAWYPLTVEKFLDGTITTDLEDGGAGTLKMALVTTSYTPANTHDFWDDVSANVVDTPKALTTPAVTSSGDTITWDADDTGTNLTWSSVAGGSTIGYVVLYNDTGTPGTSELILYSDVADTATNGGDIVITIHANGLGTIDTTPA